MRNWKICPECQGYGQHVEYVGCDCLRDKPYDSHSCGKCFGTGVIESGKRPFKDNFQLKRQEVAQFMKTTKGECIKTEKHKRYVSGLLPSNIKKDTLKVCPKCKEFYYYHPSFHLCNHQGKPISHAKDGWLREYIILCSGQVIERQIHPDFRQKLDISFLHDMILA